MKKNIMIVVTYISVFLIGLIFGGIYAALNPVINTNEDLFIRFNSIVNLFIYGTLFLIFVIVIKQKLYNDYMKSLKEWKFTILLMILSVILLYTVNFFASAIMSALDITDTSINQEALEMIRDGALFDKVSLIIFAVFFAPFVEEIVFRKGIYEIGERVNPVVGILLSGLLFGLIHVTAGDFEQLIYYAGLGFTLAFIYYVSEKNIWLPIFTHFVINVLATIVMFA